MRPILILGLGYPLQGDDGVGCYIAEQLMQRELPDEVEAMDGGTPGIGLLNLFEGRTRVIIIDAAEMSAAPGEWKRFRAQEVALTGSAERISLHRSGVADALALARGLDMPLPEIVFYGIQPLRVDWGQTLSEPVQAAVSLVMDAILKEVFIKR